MHGHYTKRSKLAVPWGAISFGSVAFAVLLSRWRWPELLGVDWVNRWGVVPARLFEDLATVPHWWQSPQLTTLVSALFIHAGFGHLIGNLIFLWLFAQRVERRLGWIRSLGMYLLAGIVANLWAAFQATASAAPIIGSSGVTSALLGAFLVLVSTQPHRRDRATGIVSAADQGACPVADRFLDCATTDLCFFRTSHCRGGLVDPCSRVHHRFFAGCTGSLVQGRIKVDAHG